MFKVNEYFDGKVKSLDRLRLQASPRPLAVDETPHRARWVRVPQLNRQAFRADIVITVQGREPGYGPWESDRGESRVAGGRVGAAVVHGRRYGDSGGHLVV